MKVLVLFSVLNFGFSSFCSAQQEPQTIKIKKESDLSNVVFDNTEDRLMVIDRFGNPRENKVLAYTLYVRNGRSTRDFQGLTNKLTPEMLNYLRSQSSAVKLFFTNIKVRDEHDAVLSLPDCIETWFPDCQNCAPTKMKKRP